MIEEAANAAGLTFNKWSVYRALKGLAYRWPGQPASMDEFKTAATLVGHAMGKRADFATGPGTDGRGGVLDFATFCRLLQEGEYFVGAGVYEKDLVPGPTPSYNNFQHWELGVAVDGGHIDYVDSFRKYDGGSDRATLAAYAKALSDNWDSTRLAIAWRWL